jgi:hypothetical protein
MLREADARGYRRVETSSVPQINDEAERALAERGFTYEGYDEAQCYHRWTYQATDLVNIEICFFPYGDFSRRKWTAGRSFAEFGEAAAYDSAREISEQEFGRTLLRLIAEAFISRLCGDCGVPMVTPWPIFRPRDSEHAVCDGCSKLYRNCAVCGEETRHRVCDWCSCACFVKTNFPDSLTPAQRVWFTIMYSFSIFDEPGSVTRIAKLARTNVPTAKRVVARAGDMLERVIGADGIARYRLQLAKGFQSH